MDVSELIQTSLSFPLEFPFEQDYTSYQSLFLLCRKIPMPRKDPSSEYSFVVATADNGKSDHQRFHPLQCQQRSELCEGPGK